MLITMMAPTVGESSGIRQLEILKAVGKYGWVVELD
jgi:hypothetical protein